MEVICLYCFSSICPYCNSILNFSWGTTPMALYVVPLGLSTIWPHRQRLDLIRGQSFSLKGIWILRQASQGKGHHHPVINHWCVSYCCSGSCLFLRSDRTSFPVTFRGIPKPSHEVRFIWKLASVFHKGQSQ